MSTKSQCIAIIEWVRTIAFAIVISLVAQHNLHAGKEYSSNKETKYFSLKATWKTSSEEKSETSNYLTGAETIYVLQGTKVTFEALNGENVKWSNTEGLTGTGETRSKEFMVNTTKDAPFTVSATSGEPGAEKVATINVHVFNFELSEVSHVQLTLQNGNLQGSGTCELTTSGVLPIGVRVGGSNCTISNKKEEGYLQDTQLSFTIDNYVSTSEKDIWLSATCGGKAVQESFFSWFVAYQNGTCPIQHKDTITECTKCPEVHPDNADGWDDVKDEHGALVAHPTRSFKNCNHCGMNCARAVAVAMELKDNQDDVLNVKDSKANPPTRMTLSETHGLGTGLLTDLGLSPKDPSTASQRLELAVALATGPGGAGSASTGATSSHAVYLMGLGKNLKVEEKDGQATLVPQITNYLWNYVDPGELSSLTGANGAAHKLQETYGGEAISGHILEKKGNQQ